MREDAVQYSQEVKTVPDLPMTIGHDGLGEIVEVGPDVENLRVGDRVVVICSITCGFCKYCRTERQHLCQTKKTMGFLTKFGEGPAYLRRYKDGLWKISRMLITLDCMTTLERGWGMLAERILPFPPRDRA